MIYFNFFLASFFFSVPHYSQQIIELLAHVHAANAKQI